MGKKPQVRKVIWFPLLLTVASLVIATISGTQTHWKEFGLILGLLPIVWGACFWIWRAAVFECPSCHRVMSLSSNAKFCEICGSRVRQ